MTLEPLPGQDYHPLLPLERDRDLSCQAASGQISGHPLGSLEPVGQGSFVRSFHEYSADTDCSLPRRFRALESSVTPTEPYLFWDCRVSCTLTCTHLCNTCVCTQHTHAHSRQLLTTPSVPSAAGGPLGPIQGLWHPVEGSRIMNTEWNKQDRGGSAHHSAPPPAALRTVLLANPSQLKSKKLKTATQSDLASLTLICEMGAVMPGLLWKFTEAQ